MALVVHGGAGLIRRASLTPEREALCAAGLQGAMAAGRAVLEAGGTALDAVEAAVVALEDNPVFNAGRGAVLAAGGLIELDAAIMDGRTRAAGAVGGATRPKNPVRLARAVMEHTEHVLLVGAGADALAFEVGLQVADRDWFVTPEREAQFAQVSSAGSVQLDHDGAVKDVYGTVGAVACDASGHVAAATSTGGMVNKRHGRVGDTPIIGAGTFAWDDTCAASGTGHGEPFMRLGVAARISARMEMLGSPLLQACEQVVLKDLVGTGGRGGVIAVDRAGTIAMPFNTAGMFRGWWQQGAQPHVAIW